MKISSYVIGIISILLLNSCIATSKHNSIQTNRALLQEYFLCCYLIHGFDDLRLDTCDISPSIYFDIAQYDPIAFNKLTV